ncbi:MAG TPA: hypothetical protein VER55_02755, partial [Ardenticatenaceae bacterium]|nr:hypothetical protein [Ardenticatenaceae bacterium]
FLDRPSSPTDSVAPPSETGLTRRRLLTRTVVGSVAVAGVGAAGVAGAVRVADSTAAELRERSEAALERFQGLVALYERLEGVDLDGIVGNGLAAVAGALGGVQGLAERLQGGLERAGTSLAELDESLAVLDNGLAAAEEAVNRLAAALQALEDRLEAAGERVAPLAEAIGGFFTGLLSRLPFGMGERIAEVLERITAVVTSVPETIASVNDGLIGPLRQRFFPREGDTIHVRLFDPLIGALFDPADRLLAAVSALTEKWQVELAGPAEQHIEARAEIRDAIARYKSENDLAS